MDNNELDKIIQETRIGLKYPQKKSIPNDDIIMIVDDDESLIKTLEFVLKDKYKIILCRNGYEAIDKYKKNINTVATILLDIKMDGKDGLTVFNEIKALNPTLPVIFNTAYPGEYKPLEIIQSLHPFGYIIKGSDSNILYDNINSAVTYYKLHKEKNDINCKLNEMVNSLRNLQQTSNRLNSLFKREKLYSEIVKNFLKFCDSENILFFAYIKKEWKLESYKIKSKKDLTILTELSLSFLDSLLDKRIIIIEDIKENNDLTKLISKFSNTNKFKNLAFFPLYNKDIFFGAIILINYVQNEKFVDFNQYIANTLMDNITLSIRNIKLLESEVENREVKTIGRMAGSIIHDINSPLQVINSYACLISMEIEEAESETINKYLQKIFGEIENISSMTEELYAFLKRQTSKLNLEKHNIKKLITNIHSKVAEKYTANNIKFDLRFEYNGLIVVDSVKFERIMHNLLDNARKAIINRGKIIITVSKIDKFVEIEIEDNGVGINEKNISKIFEPFYTESKSKGLGLGMYIVKRFINQHNGSINVSSKFGKGTKFTIKLPFDLDL